MDLVVSGLANKQIAHQLGVSEKTVEVHRKRVMRKMEGQLRGRAGSLCAFGQRAARDGMTSVALCSPPDTRRPRTPETALESAMPSRHLGLMLALTWVGLLPAAGCDQQPQSTGGAASRPTGEVVVYTALDRQFSEPILEQFTKATGIQVRAKYDTESTKTVGLVNTIIAEAARPRCDVFWNNEILNTLRLKSEGLLQPCQPPRAANFPAQYRDPQAYWYGLAARARVLLVNTELVPAEKTPTSIRDLAAPEWRGRVGIAKPLFGTTASHVACLFASLGEEQAIALLDSLKHNEIQVVGGNKSCAEMVGAGRLAFGLTDTDDAIIEVEAGRPVRIVFPRRRLGRHGNTVPAEHARDGEGGAAPGYSTAVDRLPAFAGG